MDTRKTLDLIKKFTESSYSEIADEETLEVYSRNVRRFIRPMTKTKTLISSNYISADFSLSDIVNKEQITNPKITSDDGKFLNKLSTKLDINFDSNDPIFDLDEDVDVVFSNKPVEKKKMSAKVKKTKTRYS